MHGVRLVAHEPAARAGKAYFVRAQHSAQQPDEQRDPGDHDGDREQAATGARQSDIAETGRGERRHREVERVRVVFDSGVGGVLRLVDDAVITNRNTTKFTAAMMTSSLARKYATSSRSCASTR